MGAQAERPRDKGPALRAGLTEGGDGETAWLGRHERSDLPRSGRTQTRDT